MYRISLHFSQQNHDEVSVTLWEMGTSGIVEQDDGTWLAFFPERPDMDPLRGRWPDILVEAYVEPLGTFAAAPASDHDPIYIGSRFAVVHSSLDESATDRLRIVVDSVTAFGTGRHESTQMVLELLETLVKGGQRIIDVGCGSGILSEAARLLAPLQVIACDIDESAIRAVRSQFDFPVFLGSADALPNQSADLVLANISKQAVDALAPEIKRILKPSGQVVVGGFIQENVPSRYRPLQELQRGDWLCWLCSREGILVDEQRPGQVLHHPVHWW